MAASPAAAKAPGRRANLRARIAASAPVVVRVAAGLTLLHLVDDGIRDGLAETIVPAAAVVAAALAFPYLRPATQAWLAFVYGAVAALDAVVHLSHLSRGGELGGADLTGFLHAAGGIALLAVALALVLRPKAPRTRVRRWTARAGAVALALLTLLVLVYPFALVGYAVHKPPIAVDASALGLPQVEVTLRTADDLALAGSYVAPENGAVVVLVHGAGGDRSGTIASHARMLVRHGYGVLLYDARGCGNSEGRPENLAWTWPLDIRAAVAFLDRRPEVRTIGALGLSAGAEALLEAAPDEPRIEAVVAEGAQAHTLAEMRALPARVSGATLPVWAVTFGSYAVAALESPPPPIQEQMPRIAPRPVFLIAADDEYERATTSLYEDAAAGPVERWVPEGAAHTGGIEAQPAEYERRVVTFFDDALLGR